MDIGGGVVNQGGDGPGNEPVLMDRPVLLGSPWLSRCCWWITVGHGEADKSQCCANDCPNHMCRHLDCLPWGEERVERAHSMD